MQQTSEMQTYDTTKGRKKKPVSRRGVARDFSFSLGNSENLRQAWQYGGAQEEKKGLPHRSVRICDSG
jgi:hypothetical protein